MVDKFITAIFLQEGAPGRVRGLIALGLTGTACWLAIDGVLPVQTFVTAWVAAIGVYIGARIATP